MDALDEPPYEEKRRGPPKYGMGMVEKIGVTAILMGIGVIIGVGLSKQDNAKETHQPRVSTRPSSTELRDRIYEQAQGLDTILTHEELGRVYDRLGLPPPQKEIQLRVTTDGIEALIGNQYVPIPNEKLEAYLKQPRQPEENIPQSQSVQSHKVK